MLWQYWGASMRVEYLVEVCRDSSIFTESYIGTWKTSVGMQDSSACDDCHYEITFEVKHIYVGLQFISNRAGKLSFLR